MELEEKDEKYIVIGSRNDGLLKLSVVDGQTGAGAETKNYRKLSKSAK